ncbi:MAG: hypothetical protein II975_07755 [Bacteroidales bacterium]|nr:hypothetical protein [Bacteroidales bacterium]MBQ6741801.1 hypothetical protein [Bacteroidales bacterium]
MSFCQESTGKLEKIASFTGDGDEYLILSDYDVTKSYIYIFTGWGYSMAFGGGWGASQGKTEVLRSAGGATITFASVAEIDQCISQLQKALDMKDQNKKNSRMFY